MPPKVKCIFTGEYHFYNDECNCEEGDFKARKIEELEHLKKMISEPLGVAVSVPDHLQYDNFSVNNTAAINAMSCTICVKCAICGDEIPMSWYGGGTYVCEECKKAIKFLKEKFKLELEEYEV
jgi:hypothetical protein